MAKDIRDMTTNGKAKGNGHVRYEGISSDMKCGIGPCKFGFLQSYGRMGMFVCAYSFSALITSVLSMYIVSQITTIEKQFGLNSSQSGFLLSCNDLGFLLTTLIASYFARRVHIPRVLWGTVIIYGIAGLFCSLPYFLSKDFTLEQASTLIDVLTSQTIPPENMSAVASISSRQSPMCHIQTYDSQSGYAIPTQNGSHCDVDGAETSFGVGEPNRYTRMAMTVIAIGELSNNS